MTTNGSPFSKIFECIIGSHAYGTNIATSDVDIKGVYVQSVSDILGNKYKEQENVDKDTTYYEIRRFLELIASGNPTLLEMLFVDDKFVKVCSDEFRQLRNNKERFLTKHVFNSFAGYAYGQIEKARGLNKKMNWEEKEMKRLTPLDFCFYSEDGKSKSLAYWLFNEDIPQELCGLTALDRMPGNYCLYIDYTALYGRDLNKPLAPLGYRGIIEENSNELRLSSIRKNTSPELTFYYNQDAYTLHCKKYKEYTTWLENRNEARYVDVKSHGQRIDGKNMAHCVRLINCAIEIATTGTFSVFRPEDEIKYLLSIRRGEVDLESLIKESEEKLQIIKELSKKSVLPDNLDTEFIHNTILSFRK